MAVHIFKSVVVVCLLCFYMNVIAQKLNNIIPQKTETDRNDQPFQLDFCPAHQCPLQCRMARRQSKCRGAFENGHVTQEFMNSIGNMFRNKSFVEFSKTRLNDVLNVGFLDEQKLTCPTLKRFAIEMVTTKVTIILDKIKKKILASTNQTSAKGPVDTNNTTLPSGIGKETYEMYRPSYAQTLHSLIKKEYYRILLGQSTLDKVYSTCICGISLQFDCITRETLKNMVCRDACQNDQTIKECKWPLTVHRRFEEFCIKEKLGKLPKGPMSSIDLGYMMNMSMEYVIGQLRPKYTADLIVERQEEIKESCKKMGIARTTHLRKQIKGFLVQNKDNKTMSSAVTKILTACGASIGELGLFVSGEDLVKAYDPSVKMSRREAAKMKKALLTEKQNLKNLSKEEITKFLPLIARDQRQMQKLDSSTLKSALPEINKLELTPSQRMKTWRKLKEDSAFKDLSAIGRDTLLDLGATIGALQPKEIRNIPAAALGEAISTGNLTGAQFSRKAASDVFEKFKQHLGKITGNLTADELENMGSNLHCLRARQFEEVSGAELLKLLENKTLENSQSDHCSLDKHAIRIIAAKVKSEIGGTNVLMTSPLFRGEVGVIDDSIIDDLISRLMDGNSIEDFKFTRRQAFKVLNSLKTDLGLLSTWTVELVNNIAVTNLLAFVTPADMDDLRNNPSSIEFLHLFNQDGVVSEKNNKMLGEVLVEKFGLDNSSADMSTSGLTEDIVRQVGSEVIGRLTNDQLKKLNMTDTITDLLTSINLNTIPCSILQQRTQFVIEEKKNSCSESLPSKYTEEDLATLGLLIAVDDPSAIATINTSAMLAGYSELMNEKRAFKEMRRQRRERGFINDLSEAEITEEIAANKALGKLIIQTIIASKSLRRKRQASGSLTCAEIQEMDTETLSSLTVELISGLADDQFADCASVLGVVSDYSKEQLQALAAVAKRPGVWGDPANWNSSNIQEAAVIVEGLSLAEINQMSFDLNAASKLGEFDVWSDDKKAALFNKTLIGLKYVEAKQLTASDISSLGHILCGASMSDLATIPADVYGLAAEAVGEVTSCGYNKLFVFSNLAMLYFGEDVTQWNASTINALGVVIGGLADQVSKFEETHLNAIEAKYVQYLPKSFILALSNDQLEKLTMEQALALSTEQLCTLDQTKWTILEKVAGTTLQTSSCPRKLITTSSPDETYQDTTVQTISSTNEPDKIVSTTSKPDKTDLDSTMQISSTTSKPAPASSANLVQYNIGFLIMFLILTFVIS